MRVILGDKLLEVNGTLLENLSYQEVVTTLRESPQVAHLVLEKGIGYADKSEQDISHSNLNHLFFQQDPRDDERNCNTLPPYKRFMNNSKLTQGILHADSVDSFESFHTDEGNSFSSLPTSIESNLNCAKETSSPPSSYQHHQQNKGKLSPQSGDDLFVNKTSNDNFVSSPPHAKDDNRLQNGLTSYKSTPNLNDSSDEEGNPNSPSKLYRNRSSDCLLYSPHFMNPHQALFDLYQNYSYIRGRSLNL